MPEIILARGESVTIVFADTESEIHVAHVVGDHGQLRPTMGSPCNSSKVLEKLPNGIVVHASLPDSSGREGLVYHEPYHMIPQANEAVPIAPLMGEDETSVMAARVEAVSTLAHNHTIELPQFVRDGLGVIPGQFVYFVKQADGYRLMSEVAMDEALGAKEG